MTTKRFKYKKVSNYVMKMTHVTLTAAMALGLFAAKDVAAENPCRGQSVSWLSYSVGEGETCPGQKFGGNICVVDCARRSVRNPVTLEKLEKTLQQAHKPKRGKNYTVSEVRAARHYLSEWKESDVSNLIKKLNGNLSEDEKKIFAGSLKYWLLIKYHSYRLNIDPRISFLIAVTESKLKQESGSSGEVGVMQIMRGTATEVYNAYHAKDPVLRNAGKDWRKDKDVMVVLALYYLRDMLYEVGVAPSAFPTDQQLIYLYMKYNGGNKILKNGEINEERLQRWWQGSNLAVCAKKYMKLYPLVENFVDQFIAMHKTMEQKKAVLASKPKTEEKRERKGALVKKLDTQIAKHMAAKKILKDEIDNRMSELGAKVTPLVRHPNSISATQLKVAKMVQTAGKKDTSAVNLNGDVIPHTYFIAQAKADAEKKTANASVQAEPIITAQKASGKREIAPKAEVLVVQNTAMPRLFEREISDLGASQARLREQNMKFESFIDQLRSAKNGRRR
jgi:hypothetical protein